MSRYRRALCAPVFVLSASVAIARPNFGRDCSDCHNGGAPPVPALEIINFDGMVDPDESMTGATDRGLLKFYAVEPGGSIDLQIRVDFQELADYVYAVELRRLETSGVESFGMLEYSPDPDWFMQIGDTLPDPDRPYFTIPDEGGIPFTEPQVFTFTMQVTPSTDSDYYDLEFAIAGQPGFFYTEEHFYLHVVPEPATVALFAVGLLVCAPRRRRVRH